MAINTTTRQTTAFTSGNNFAFAFKVYEVGDVKVIRITTSTGAEEVLTITTHYTVTLNDDQNANPGGTVTLVNSGNPVNLGSGFNVVITSKVTPLQQTEITNQGGFFPEVINDVLDKAAILDQQQQSILDKTIRFPLTQTVGGLEITENAANRAGKVVQFDGSGDLVILGTVDGRDVSADGTKLDGIESNATADQTAAEIRTLVESASDSNVFTDADHNKLNAIEAGATGDQNASEIRTLVESANDSNVFTDNDHTKLNNIEDNATRDQTASEIKTLIASSPLDASHLGANSVDSSELVNGSVDHVHLSNDCVDGDNVQDDAIDNEHIAANAVRVNEIKDGEITSAKLNPATVITASEQASATTNDTSFLTSAAADARFFNISTGDTIKDGDTFPDNDTTIATTAAINDRIIDLVDDVGGFVPIANETSFPTANPDAENGTGTVVSVKAASTNLTPSGTTVTIANGAGTGNTVTITGVPSVIPSGFGFIVETTTTLHTYTFHRLVPKATEVTTVAGKAVEIGRLGTADAVADMAILGTTDVVADLNMLATTDIVADMALLATTDVIADMALLAVTDVISDMNDLATSANITAMANCSNNISSINNASSNLNSINNFGNTYQIAANDPTTDGGGNSLAEGDLYFNTSANRLKVYDGSSWVNGVEISGSGAVTTGNTFTGDNRYNDGVKALFGTGSDLQIYHSGSHSIIAETGTGILYLGGNQVQLYGSGTNDILLKAVENGAVDFYYDNSKKFETTSYGAKVTDFLNVGKTNTPSKALELYQASNAALRIQNSSTGVGSSDGFLLEQSGLNTLLVNYESGNLDFKTANSTRLLIINNGDVQIPADNKKLLLGAGQDLEIYHNGTNSIIDNINTGAALQIKSPLQLKLKTNQFVVKNSADTESLIYAAENNKVVLYYDGSEKLETTSTGIQVLNGAANVNLYSGTVSSSGGGQITFKNVDGNGFPRDVVRIKGDTSGNGGYGELTLQTAFNNTLNDCLIIKKDKHIELPNDNQKLKIGASQDLQIYHDGSASHIKQITDAQYLNIHTNDFWVGNAAGTETYILANHDDGVDLYYDNAKKAETISTGLKVSSSGNAELKITSATSSAATLEFGDTGNDDEANISYDNYNGFMMYRTSANADMRFYTNGTHRLTLHKTGYLAPAADSTYDIGTSSVRFANGYFDTLYGDGSNLTGINTDLVSDTSPQLGGDLDTNGHEISLDDNHKIKFGDSNDFHIKHDGANWIESMSTHPVHITVNNANEYAASFRANNSVDLYYDNSKKLATTPEGVEFGTDSFTGTRNSNINTEIAKFQASNTSGSNYLDNHVVSIGQTNGNWVDGATGSQDTSFGLLWHYADSLIGNRALRAGICYDHKSTEQFKIWSSYGAIAFYIHSGNAGNSTAEQCDIKCAEFDGNGHFVPGGNDSRDLGTSSLRWRNIYTNDLNLSNEGSSNEVDGTWGSYTIQEGAESLFLINKRNGKKYKFNLTEVS